MKNLVLYVLISLFVACKNETKITNAISNDKDTLTYNVKTSDEIHKLDSILYFENALIYEMDVDGRKEEVWFFVNEKTGQILYEPKDEMIDAIVSFPNGDYNIYAKGEFEGNVILKEHIDQVASQDKIENVLESNEQIKIIKQVNSQPYDIICKGFKMNYQEMEGSEILFATTQIPVNAWQIYGFSKLEGDALFPINLNYLNVFNSNYLITHIYYPQLALRLITYESNPYEFEISGYKEK